jgi:drug/metabolite transporter (DMT)-like permease
LVGFTAYAWLLKATTPARASTYAYINPVIAVFLGWALGGEALTGRMLLAAGIIVFGVVIITTRRTAVAKPSASAVATKTQALVASSPHGK